MPEFNVFYNYNDRGINKTRSVKLQAIGETHLKQVFYKWAKEVKKKFCKIIYTKQL